MCHDKLKMTFVVEYDDLYTPGPCVMLILILGTSFSNLCSRDYVGNVWFTRIP